MDGRKGSISYETNGAASRMRASHQDYQVRYIRLELKPPRMCNAYDKFVVYGIHDGSRILEQWDGMENTAETDHTDE